MTEDNEIELLQRYYRKLEYKYNRIVNLLYDQEINKSFANQIPFFKLEPLRHIILLCSYFDAESNQEIFDKYGGNKIIYKSFKPFNNYLEEISEIKRKTKFKLPVKQITVFYRWYKEPYLVNLYTIMNFPEDNFIGSFIKKLTRVRRENRKAHRAMLKTVEPFLIKAVNAKEQVSEFDALDKRLKKTDVFSDVRRHYKYPEKDYYRILYELLYSLNENSIKSKSDITDFKCMFFDLLKILLLDETLTSETKFQFPTERQNKPYMVNKILGL